MEKAPCRMKNPSSSVQEAIALRRMSLVQQIIELIHQHWPLSAALEQVASSHPLPGDPDAPPHFVAQRTLEDWYYAFKKGGFEGLKPKRRSDRGQPRRLGARATAVDPGTGSFLSRGARQTALPAMRNKPIPLSRLSRRSIAGWNRMIWMPKAAGICCARTFRVPPKRSKLPASTTSGSSTSPPVLSSPCIPKPSPLICA